MKSTVICVGLVLLTACASRTSPSAPERYSDVEHYRAARVQLIEKERARRLGADLVLTPEEEAANRRLMALKQAELDRTRENFPPTRSFLLNATKQLIAASPVLE
ncbi:MAG: hypothetical protein ACRD1H_13085, partial [Vicinamibacterales bacterium]